MATEPVVAGDSVADELADERACLMDRADLVIAIGARQDGVAVAQTPAEEANEIEAGFVGPVDVLDDQQLRR